MRKRLLATVLLSLFVPFFALAANSELFSIAPSRGTSSWLLYEIRPGESMTDNVIVRNLGTKVQTISLVALDAQPKAPNDTSEAFLLTGRDAPQTSIGKWTTISQPTVTLQPGENKSIPFTVLIPTPTEKEKEFRGAIVASPVTEDATGKKGGKSVSVSTEVALRMHVKVTDNPKLTDTTKPMPSEAGATETEGKSEEDASSMNRNLLIGAAAVVVIAGLGYAFMRK